MFIDLCFQGWLRGVEIDNVSDGDGQRLYVRNAPEVLLDHNASGSITLNRLPTPAEIAQQPAQLFVAVETITKNVFIDRLNSGVYFVSLSDCLNTPSDDSSIEISDFKESD